MLPKVFRVASTVVHRAFRCTTRPVATDGGDQHVAADHANHIDFMNTHPETITGDQPAGEDFQSSGSDTRHDCEVSRATETGSDETGDHLYFARVGDLVEGTMPQIDELRDLENGRPLPPPRPLPANTPGAWEWQQIGNRVIVGFRIAVSIPMSSVRLTSSNNPRNPNSPPQTLQETFRRGQEALAARQDSFQLRPGVIRGASTDNQRMHGRAGREGGMQVAQLSLDMALDPSRMEYLRTFSR